MFLLMETLFLKVLISCQVYTLCGIFLAIAIVSILIIAIFLDHFKHKQSNKTEKMASMNTVTATVRHLKNKYQLLIVPFTLWSGFEQAFISADYTKSFVACTKGTEFVGWTMICYGVCDTLGSYFFGFLVKYVGRLPIILLACCMNYGVILAFIFWSPNENQVHVLFILPAIWGLSDSVWQTQINCKLTRCIIIEFC
jgi:predicted MFS family arabinose efflux permease